MNNLNKQFMLFKHSSYLNSLNKKKYLQNLLYTTINKKIKQIKNSKICLSFNQFKQIINDIKINLRIYQFQELYWYATGKNMYYSNNDRNKNKIQNNDKIEQLDINKIAEWLYERIQSQNIKIDQFKRTSRKRSQTTSKNIPSNQNFKEQLTYLIQIFENMETQRQNSGLIPIDENKQGEQIQIPYTSIPYDPLLHDLNNKLCVYRLQAEDRFARIIQLAKNNQNIGRRLQQAINKFQYQRISANQKIGRLGALMAQKRLEQFRDHHHRKIKKMNITNNHDNLIHSMHVQQMLCLPEKQNSKFLI